jgi:hypothetical protein
MKIDKRRWTQINLYLSRLENAIDEYGVIHEAMKILPEDIKIDFLEALAELEDNECHRTRTFPSCFINTVKTLLGLTLILLI